MNNKPFEIFKPEDFLHMLEHYNVRQCAATCNNILSEKGKRGFTNLVQVVNNTICLEVTENNKNRDTHEALVFLRPIEIECEMCVLLSAFKSCRVNYCSDCGAKIPPLD